MHSAIRLSVCFSVLAAVALTFLSCEDPPPPDPDGSQAKALGLVPNFLVKDEINPAVGDKEDWRDFSTFQMSDVKATYLIGEKFGGGHKVSGVIELYDVQGNLMQRREVEPGVRNYDFEFRAEPQKHYFLRFVAKRGKANYMIENAVKPVDPCALCLAEEVCVNGACQPAGACNPPCAANESCVEGKCEGGGGNCPEGKVWSRSKKRCVAIGSPSPCPQGCKEGEVCRGGSCVAEGPSTCNPECVDPQVCRGGRCVADTGCGPISGKILNVWPSGKGSMMLLNRGSQHGVKNGHGGSIGGGGSFKIQEVFPYQSRAYTDLTREQLDTGKRVSIMRQCP